MKKKFTKEELYKMDTIEVYKLVLEKEHIKIFPKGFWQRATAIDNAIKCTKYLIEDKLKLSEEELKKQFSFKLFKENGLRGMLQYCFNNSPYEAINATYPHRFQPWEFNIVPKGYWDDINNRISATKWLIETKLKLSEEELKEQLSAKLFYENGLKGMLDVCFNSSPYEAINKTYPNRFQPWEFKIVPNGYWSNIDNAIKCTKWLIEVKLQLSEEELMERLSFNLFHENGLSRMLRKCFNGSPYEAINTAYPERNYQPWEFNIVPMGYWDNIDNGVLATKWLIETKLQLSEEDLKEQLSQQLFYENGLSGMLNTCFNNSPYEAINKTYPNKFKKSDFKNCKYYK